MADTIPADNHVIGDTGHVTDHNNMADMLGLICQALAQMSSGTESATNTTNVSQISNWVSNNLYTNPNGLVTQGSSTVTSATFANLATSTYLANDANVGSYYELEAWGHGTQATGTRQALSVQVSFGSTAMTSLTIGSTALSSAGVAFRWWGKVRVMCLTTGSGATWQSFLQFGVNDFTATNLAPGNNDFAIGSSTDNVSTYSVSSTANHAFSFQAAWASTSGSPTLTCDWFIKRGVT